MCKTNRLGVATLYVSEENVLTFFFFFFFGNLLLIWILPGGDKDNSEKALIRLFIVLWLTISIEIEI